MVLALSFALGAIAAARFSAFAWVVLGTAIAVMATAFGMAAGTFAGAYFALGVGALCAYNFGIAACLIVKAMRGPRAAGH